MTTLEIFLIAIIWIMYGVFATYQTGNNIPELATKDWLCFWYIIAAPGVLLCKALYGAFKKYE